MRRVTGRISSHLRLVSLLGIVGGLLLACILLIRVYPYPFNFGTLPRLTQTATGTTSIGTIPGVVTYSNLARTHVTGTVTYAQNPPVGGPHNPVWLNCGVYTAPVANENAVHSMEHGAVWITYQPNLPQSAVQHLISLANGHSYVILSPYPGLPSPVVASAWGSPVKAAERQRSAHR